MQHLTPNQLNDLIAPLRNAAAAHARRAKPLTDRVAACWDENRFDAALLSRIEDLLPNVVADRNRAEALWDDLFCDRARDEGRLSALVERFDDVVTDLEDGMDNLRDLRDHPGDYS